MANEGSPETQLKLILRQFLGARSVSQFSDTNGEVYVHLRVSDVEGLCLCFNLLGQHGAKFGTTDMLDARGKISQIRLHVSLNQSEDLKDWLTGEVQ